MGRVKPTTHVRKSIAIVQVHLRIRDYRRREISIIDKAGILLPIREREKKYSLEMSDSMG